MWIEQSVQSIVYSEFRIEMTNGVPNRSAEIPLALVSTGTGVEIGLDTEDSRFKLRSNVETSESNPR